MEAARANMTAAGERDWTSLRHNVFRCCLEYLLECAQPRAGRLVRGTDLSHSPIQAPACILQKAFSKPPGNGPRSRPDHHQNPSRGCAGYGRDPAPASSCTPGTPGKSHTPAKHGQAEHDPGSRIRQRDAE